MAGKQTKKPTGTFSDDERAAMQERARELKAGKMSGEQMLLDKIAEMPEPDRSMATRIHEIVTKSASTLSPKTWYGMPAYANKDGKVVIFFRAAFKFKERYAMLGFNDSAKLDDGAMWPIAYALAKLTRDDEAKIAALVEKSVK